MSDSIQIKLAAKEYTVRRLTLRQSLAIAECVSRPAPAASTAYSSAIDQAVGIVAAALARDYPEVTIDTVLDAEVSATDLLSVSRSLLEFGEFVAAKPTEPILSNG